MTLQLENLSKHFIVRADRGKATVRAVESVNLDVPDGQTVALVGESGCGKTTIAKLVLMLEKPTGGAIRFNGKSLDEMTRRDVKDYRRQVQAVFQDPYASLNPRLTVKRIIAEPILAHQRIDRVALNTRISELLDAASASASRLPARWRSNRASSSWMSRSRRSMYRYARRF